MKKILASCFALVMVLSLSFSAFAAHGSFAVSPSGNPTPVIIITEIDGEDGLECGAKIIITSYSDIEQLTKEDRELMEYAYDVIYMSDDLTELNPDLAKIATDLNIEGGNLVVSDLFNIHLSNCDVHNHENFKLVIQTDTLDKFVGLLHMSEIDKWDLISNAKVINNGTQLEFSANSFGPFAIVVEADPHDNISQTGDNSKIYIYAIVMAVSALALVVIIVTKKRKQDKQ